VLKYTDEIEFQAAVSVNLLLLENNRLNEMTIPLATLRKIDRKLTKRKIIMGKLKL